MKIKYCTSFFLALFTIILTLLPASHSFAEDLKGRTWIYTQTSESNKSMTADRALQLLKAGNARFVEGQSKNKDLLKQAKLTIKGQYPFAIVLSCIDSRGSPELIFDQGIGDMFSTRLAGNVLDADQLGGMEYAAKVIGSHLIVVMGHTRCGAVAGACSNVELGNLTQLLEKIQPAINDVKKSKNVSSLNCQDYSIVDEIAQQNVRNVMADIKSKSDIIRKLIASGDVKIIGAMHDLRTGKVRFFE